ncbi:MAG: cytochrome P450 [Gammaproteobacteria bacterium]|nr:cytochrome P450 [Gammaproteobacteria bacterium]NNM00994.1 cytochrome P450 [Gammaproteobacteria bacterium]
MTAAGAIDIRGFDLRALDASFYDDPYPTYRALREQQPIYRCPDSSYFLTRHADIREVYRQPRLYSSDKHKQFHPIMGDGPLFEHHTTSLVFSDPPLHTYVRKAIGNALSSKTVEALAPRVGSMVATLLDEFEERGEFDLVNDYATIIPIQVIGDLMRVPDDERGPLRAWSLAILGGLEANLTAEQLARGNRAVSEFIDYLDDFVARRRSSLSDDHDDMLARLIRWESDGQRLTGHTLYHQCIFILNAGHETTSNLIANGTLTLLARPDKQRQLLENPALVDSAVEELLRFESPNQLGNRTTTAVSEIGGVEIPADTVLTLAIGAANRDPEQFPDPDNVDLARSPNEHLAFAAGIHTCAGLNVARLEGRIAILELLRRFPGLHVSGPVTRQRRARFRGVGSAPLATT